VERKKRRLLGAMRQMSVSILREPASEIVTARFSPCAQCWQRGFVAPICTWFFA
jgi:hypothetical protein